MLNLYDVIYNIINPIVDSYAEHYPSDKKKVYPFAEINFPSVSENNEYSDLNQLYIDIWDNKSGQVKEIETITDNLINAILQGKNTNTVKTTDMLIQFSKDKPFRVKLEDSDINIQRRELRFILKVYGREE